MTYFQIPARNDLPYYKFKISLSGIFYTLNFRYNGRMSRWVVDINDSSNNQILSGIVCLNMMNLTGQYRTLAIPKGVFFCTNDLGQSIQPTQFSFGQTNSMWYGDPTQ